MEKKNYKKCRILIQINSTNAQPWNDIFLKGQYDTFIKGNIHKHLKFQKVVCNQNLNSRLRNIDWWFFQKNWTSRSRLIPLTRWFLTFPLKFWKPSMEIQEENPSYDTLYIKMPDFATFGVLKNIEMFRFALKQNFDFLVMINNSTFLNLQKLVENVNTFPRKKLISGRFIDDSLETVSGSFMILSIDVVKLLVSNKLNLRFDLPNDVAISKLLVKDKFIRIKIFNKDFDNVGLIRNLNNSEIQKFVSIRCKSGNLSNRNDVMIMREIHAKVMK